MRVLTIKSIKRLLAISLMILLAVGASYAPIVQKKVIRNVVGSRVVMIKGKRSGGTGFFVKAKSGATYIMTNFHICMLKNRFNTVYITYQGKIYSRRIIHESSKHDLCLVENIKDIQGLSIGSEPVIGDVITIVGHPKLYPLTVSPTEYIGETTISIYYGTPKGRKSTKHNNSIMPLPFNPLVMQNLGTQRLVSSQLIGYSRGGNSGSPIVDFFGNVVSVLYAGNRSDNMDSYGVPFRYIEELLEQY